jgi:acyl-coenzyme A thioesterase PaaI-like protein
MALYVRTTRPITGIKYTGLLHGGMTSTLLDAAMTHCLFMQGVQALTAELTVDSFHPFVPEQADGMCQTAWATQKFTCLKHG